MIPALSEAPGSPALMDSVRGVLTRLGWVLRRRKAGRGARFSVRRLREKRALFELVLESRGGAAARAARSILPVFRLRAAIPEGGRRLLPAEAAGVQQLASGLCLLLESRQGQNGKSRVLSQSEIHEGHKGIEHILRVTYACNERCPFCFIPSRDSRVDTASLERELDALARRIGPRGTLTLSGGEPSLDPRLPALLASARRRGLRRFVLQTNGCGLARPGLLERLVALGARNYDVAFHAHEPGLYDRMTGSRGQYPAAVAGLSRLLSAKRCGVTACVLVTAWNYRQLPSLMGFLGRLARTNRRGHKDPLQICFTMLNGAGHDKAPALAVDLAQAAPFLRRALARAAREGLMVQRFTGEASLPPCILPHPDRHASALRFAQDRVLYAEDFTGAVGRAKHPACRRCPYDVHCLGVPAEYARMFGLGALGVSRA